MDTLKLGNVEYTKDELCSILQESVNGNCLIALAHQLIAAKLNVANGATCECAVGSITFADRIIGDLVVPPVGSDTLPCNISGYIQALANYNEGIMDNCPPHCDEPQDVQPFIQDNPCVR